MPRKSDAGTDIKDSIANGPSTGMATSGVIGHLKDGLSIDDHTLPKSIVTRLAKGVLPQNTNVQKDAILALSKGGTVFVNYLCATANDQAKSHGRKTINPKDILEAMRIMEFDDFLPRLEAELAKFNEIASVKRAATKKPTKYNETIVAAASCPTKHSPTDAENHGNDSPPAAKKVRVDGAAIEPGAIQAKSQSLTGNSVPARGWGDEDEEEEEEMGDEDDDDLEDAEQTESEGPYEQESDEVSDEADAEVDPDNEEDEALDNGIDSD